MKHFLLLLLISCSTNTKEKKAEAWETWKGKSASLLDQHSYFKHLPFTKIKHEDGRQTVVFKDQARYQTEAYCDSLGGCIPLPVYNCHNTFSIKENIIQNFEQKGTCPGYKVILPERATK